MNSKIEVNNIPTVGRIIISNKLKNKIDFLHRKVGRLEWSGILIYKFESGVIENMKDLIFRAIDLYPMDIGSAANTTFEYNPDDVVNMYDKITEAIEMNNGLIHSHHSLNSFVSSTDFNELINNAGNYNFYISLVVSFDENYVCKIAFPSTTTITKRSVVRDQNGEYVNVLTTEENSSILLGDLTIEFELDSLLEDWFVDKVSSLKTKKENELKKSTQNLYKGSAYNRDFNYNRPYNDWSAYGKEASFESKFPESNKSIVPAESKPTYIYTKSPSNIELFTVGLMGYDLTSYMEDDDEDYFSIQEVLADLEDWVKADIDLFEENLEDNLLNSHDIVYGEDNEFLKEHIVEAINYLAKEYTPNPRINYVKKCIQTILNKFLVELKKHDTANV